MKACIVTHSHIGSTTLMTISLPREMFDLINLYALRDDCDKIGQNTSDTSRGAQ